MVYTLQTNEMCTMWYYVQLTNPEILMLRIEVLKELKDD